MCVKKIFMMLLVSIFLLATMGFVTVNTKDISKKTLTFNGIISADSNYVKLKAQKNVYILMGQIKGLNEYNGQKVQIKGYIINKKFYVQSYMKLAIPIASVPKKAPVIDTSSTSIIGILSQNDIEGLHYELQADNAVYVLLGSNENFNKYIGKTVKLTGNIPKNQVSIYQRGTLFNVKTIELAPDDKATITNKIIKLEGIVMIDKVKGTHIGFSVGTTLYGLIGNLDGIEKLDGEKIQITGYIPKIEYIRKPDFIIFNVNEYSLLE